MAKNINRVVVLNNIRSNENVGSIFRTADATGVAKIFLCGYTPAPLDRFGRENRGLVKASLGAEKLVEWEKCENLKEALSRLQNFSTANISGGTDKILLNFSSCSAQSASQAPHKHLLSKNFVVVAIEQNKKAIDYRKIKEQSSKNIALVFGNEVEGLSEEDLKLCDVIAELPMLGQKESLNVAVCAGIVLYSLVRN